MTASINITDLTNQLSDCIENADATHAHVPVELLNETVETLTQLAKFTRLSNSWVATYSRPMPWDKAIKLLEILGEITPEKAKELKEL